MAVRISRLQVGIALIIIFASSFALRYIGIVHEVLRCTERQYEMAPLNILYSGGNPDYYIHPSLYFYIASIPLFITRYCSWISGPFHSHLEYFVYYIQHEQMFIFIGRLISVCFAVASIYIVYLIGRLYWGRRAGLIAAIFIAYERTNILYSEYMAVDVAMVFMLLVSFYYLAVFVERGQTKHAMYAGIFLGFAISTNYNAVTMACCLCIGFIIAIRIYNLNFGIAVRALVLMIMSFMLTSPYVLIDYHKAILSCRTLMQDALCDNDYLMYYRDIFLRTPIDYMFLPIFVYGIYGMIRTKQHDRMVMIISMPLIHIAAFSFICVKQDRFILPAIPFLYLPATYGIDAIYKIANNKTERVKIMANILIPLYLLLYVAGEILTMGDNNIGMIPCCVTSQYKSKLWIEKYIHPGSKIAMPMFYSPEIHPTRAIETNTLSSMYHRKRFTNIDFEREIFAAYRMALPTNTYNIYYQYAGDAPYIPSENINIQELKDNGVEYVITVGYYQDYFKKGMPSDSNTLEYNIKYYEYISRSGIKLVEYGDCRGDKSNITVYKLR